MFTGIIEETGTVKKIIGQQVSGSIEIKRIRFWKELKSATALPSTVSV